MSVPSSSETGHGNPAGFSFETRDAVVAGVAAAAPHLSASVGWLFCNGDRMRPRAQGSQSDTATCSLLLGAIDSLTAAEGAATSLAASSVGNCARRAVALPDDAAFMYHDPPAAGDVIYN